VKEEGKGIHILIVVVDTYAEGTKWTVIDDGGQTTEIAVKKGTGVIGLPELIFSNGLDGLKNKAFYTNVNITKRTADEFDASR
jgi:hypothetical protein